MKRQYGTGGITWLSEDKAKLRYWCTDPSTGQRRQRSKTVRGTELEVEAASLSLRMRYDPSTVAPQEVTLDVLVNQYLNARKKNGEPRSPYSRHKELGRYNRHIRPVLGTRIANSITTQDLNLVYNQLQENLSPSTIQKINAVLGAAYELGISFGHLSKNPTKRTRRPSVVQLPPQAPSAEAVQSHLELLQGKDHELALAVLVLSRLAIRRNELIALRWKRIDLQERWLEIREGITHTPGIGAQSTLTKTGRLGWVRYPLGDTLVEALGDHYTRYEKVMAEIGVEPTGEAFVLSPSPTRESPWYGDSLTKRLARHMDHHPELQRFTLLDLRHYAATELVAGGASLVHAKVMLRHQSTKTTERYYVAVRDQQLLQESLALQERLDHRA
jgi:integrase